MDNIMYGIVDNLYDFDRAVLAAYRSEEKMSEIIKKRAIKNSNIVFEFDKLSADVHFSGLANRIKTTKICGLTWTGTALKKSGSGFWKKEWLTSAIGIIVAVNFHGFSKSARLIEITRSFAQISISE
ncbi:hypothetical protein PENTCL1PPCAC_25334 [Pristionchus entomophagus]|uniref:Uncharacterized protein n=1 Tax=Pristionchus entomophagus TaxID=358040 RepID=A0AAV5U9W2_9BILA|nr:hypothetical protein PENTCL1PPCAC_25334 [Pristionchus entomophagus]